jgi:hypothetical protein
MGLVDSLEEKARKVFKGLDEDDYAILRFFYENGPNSKYRASRYFEGYEQQKPYRKISRATIYRKIQNLKDKQFLEVVRRGKFKRGSLKSDIEILSAETLKGNFAVLGSGIDPQRVFTQPPSKGRLIRKSATFNSQFEFFNNVLDSLIELNVDLTDKKGSFPNMMYFFNQALLIRRPSYVDKSMEQYGVPRNIKKAMKAFTKLTKFLQKEFETEGVTS